MAELANTSGSSGDASGVQPRKIALRQVQDAVDRLLETSDLYVVSDGDWRNGPRAERLVRPT